jgi:formate hydrogenlyase transcriptional activator
VIERSVVLTRGNVLELAMPETASGVTVAMPAPRGVSEADRNRILQALREANGTISGPMGAAKRLGLKRTTLQARMKKLGISRNYQ